MNNSICIFLHLQCDTGPSHMCNLQNSFTKLIQSKHRVQAGAGKHRSGGKVWKDPAFQSKKKEKSHHPTSDVMSECSSNMDLAEQLLASLFPTNTLLPSCYPSFNAPPLHYCLITWLHISNYSNFSLLHDNSTSVAIRSPSHGCVIFD